MFQLLLEVFGPRRPRRVPFAADGYPDYESGLLLRVPQVQSGLARPLGRGQVDTTEGEAMKFRKKPVVIEAMQWDGTPGSALSIMRWANRGPPQAQANVFGGACLCVHTLEGDLTISPKDWVIKGVKGEFYPCKLDIFEATYEPVEEEMTP